MKIYKLYGKSKIKGYEKIDSSNDKEKIFEEAKKLSSKEYYCYSIIEHDTILDMDNIVVQENLFEKCKVEYVDKLKTKVEVKAVTFKPSRMKKKEELRKLTEKYIER